MRFTILEPSASKIQRGTPLLKLIALKGLYKGVRGRQKVNAFCFRFRLNISIPVAILLGYGKEALK